MRRPVSRTPVSTYRIQFQPGFGFRDAQAIVTYLARLGVTECYASPYVRARPGSRHGYDVCDHNALNPELGDQNDYTAWSDALKTAGLGHLFDVVPNHMSVDPSTNVWWRDVLTYGQASRFARFFDIDWTPPKTELRGKVLLPILACQYGEALEKGELEFAFLDGAPSVRFGQIQLPIDPATMPEGTEEELVRALDGKPGEPSSFDALHHLLEKQHYRLAYWRTSSHEINYRRFFDVDELVGMRMEDPEVFRVAHELVSKLIAEGRVTGLRIDHLDGLADPAGYCERVKHLSAEPLWVVAEKILAVDQGVPDDWQLDGTTGYQFLNAVNGVFVQIGQWRVLRRIYGRFTGVHETFAELAYLSKKLVMETTLASELRVLAQMLNRISERDRRSRDFTLDSLRRALREFIACLSVYRTYLSKSGADAADEGRIRQAIHRARRRNPQLESSIFQFIADVILSSSASDQDDRRQFVTRLQQYTGPVQARGVEDTALYRYNVLVSLNEVGGDPSQPGRTVEAFHRENAQRLERWPLEMIATATHDTKLGEDVRARINVLSELPERWQSAVRRWSRINAPHRAKLDDMWAPDRNDEYRFYQVLVGTWPFAQQAAAAPGDVAAALAKRLQTYMVKAIKEAKIHTSWINDYEPYDRAVARFVERSLTGPSSAAFLDAFLPFARLVATAGMVNSLSQLVLKIASPGVPDFYQGTELWDLHLVDPDNREVVNFDMRSSTLAELEPLVEQAAGRGPIDTTDHAGAVRRLVDEWPDGRIKLFVTAAGLRLRRELASVFLNGAYSALNTDGAPDLPPSLDELRRTRRSLGGGGQVRGEGAGLIAFSRESEAGAVVAIVPRFCARFVADRDGLPLGADAWGDARVLLREGWPDIPLRNVLTGDVVRPALAGGRATLRAADVLAHCPVALLATRR